MIPRKLRITGFLSYNEPVELDFSNFDLACISGANGAGKSSLLDAITWALFGQARLKDESIINSHCDSAEVVFDFQYEGILYRIQRTKLRSKTGLLEFFIQNQDEKWRPLTEHSVRETDARIEKTLALDYDTFINASFFLQGKADQFAQQRPGERKQILANILGLDVWETYRDLANMHRKQCENDLSVLENSLLDVNSELAEEDGRRINLNMLQEKLEQVDALRKVKESALENQRKLKASIEEQRHLVDVFARQVESTRQRFELRAQELKSRKDDLQQYQLQLAKQEQVEKDYELWQHTRLELEKWNAIASRFREQEVLRAKPLMMIEREKSRLEQEVKTLKEKEAQVEGLKAQLPEYEQQLENLRLIISQSQQKISERPVLEEDLKTTQKLQSDLEAENKRLKADMTELKERIKGLEEATGALCPLCGQPLEEVDRLKLTADLEKEGKDKANLWRKNTERFKDLEAHSILINQQIKKLSEEEKKLNQAQRQLDLTEDRFQQMQRVVADWGASDAERLKHVLEVIEKKTYLMDAQSELDEIDQKIAKIGYDAAIHDEIRLQEQKQRTSEDAMRKLEAARAALVPLTKDIESLQGQVGQIEIELAHLEEESFKANEKYQKDTAGLPDLRKAELELFDLQQEANRLRMQVGGAIQAVEVLKSVKERKKILGEQREVITQKISSYKDLERAFGKEGVPALLIEQALPEIEAQANDILDRLSSGGMSVSFLTQKDYKDKKRDDKKETLDIIISDAAGPRPYELFSGGEAFRVNFAIRLALSKILARRAGARLQTLVIDEGFGSQDVVGRQRLIEAINLVRPDFAKILVITHLEELKDAFPARIEVEKSANGSHVSVQV